MAAITLCLVLLGERGYLVGVVNENICTIVETAVRIHHVRAYIWFSQYLLIWYGNLPEETTYYVSRTGKDWIVLFL